MILVSIIILIKAMMAGLFNESIHSTKNNNNFDRYVLRKNMGVDISFF